MEKETVEGKKERTGQACCPLCRAIHPPVIFF